MNERPVTDRSVPRSDVEDAALVTRISNGDKAAFEKLHSAYHNRVARFASRLIRSRETIEEVVDDTFMVVWRSAASFRRESRVSTWIIGIGYRTALKSLRSAKGQFVPINLADRACDRSDPADECALNDWVEQGLNRLPMEHRLLLELAYGLGHSMEEIATITSCPIGTVKARMFHAREKLHQHLSVLDTPRWRGQRPPM
jgi:RNA polymerase sigma-70 factor (ECF subfamily)